MGAARIDERTVTEARAQLLEDAAKGAICPCCGRWVKVYPRKLHSEMVRFLALLVKAYLEAARAYGIRELLGNDNKASTDGSYLVHWGLVTHDKRGVYRPTQRGLAFIFHGLRVPSHAFVRNNVVVGWSATTVQARDVLPSLNT